MSSDDEAAGFPADPDFSDPDFFDLLHDGMLVGGLQPGYHASSGPPQPFFDCFPEGLIADEDVTTLVASSDNPSDTPAELSFFDSLPAGMIGGTSQPPPSAGSSSKVCFTPFLFS